MNFDAVIPLGEECYTCMTVDNKFGVLNLRKNAYPFDYVVHSFIDKILLKLQNKSKAENIVIKKFGDKYFYYDNVYGFCYWHDVSYDDEKLFTLNDYDTFVKKYNRRYERLYETIETFKKIVFISVNHFNKIYNNENQKKNIEQLYKYLHCLNNNIVFISFNFYDHDETYDNFYHYALKYDKIDNDFILSKNNFENILKIKMKQIFKEL